MIEHVVLLQLSDSASEEELQQMYAEIAALEDRIEGFESVHKAENVSPEGKSKGFKHGFVICFKDQEARDIYLEHPDHIEVAEEYIEPLVEDVLVFDYER